MKDDLNLPPYPPRNRTYIDSPFVNYNDNDKDDPFMNDSNKNNTPF